MIELLNQGWVGTTIGLLGLVVGLVGILLYLNSRIGGRPTCQMKTLRLIWKAEQTLPRDVDIRYRGTSVSRLSLTRLYFWNSGKETIDGDQIVDNDRLRFVFEPSTEILKAHVATVTREVNNFNISVSEDSKSEAFVSFDFLDPGDGAKIEILHTAEQRYPCVSGTLKGIPSGVQNITPSKPINIDGFLFTIMRRKSLFAKIFLSTGILSLLLAFTPEALISTFLDLVANEPNGKIKETFSIRFAFFFSGLLYTVTPALYFLTAKRKYPYKLDQEKSDYKTTKNINKDCQ